MLVVVGGHSRNIGKTSVVCGIVRGLPDLNWTAIKITQFGHNVCARDGETCDCADPKHPIAVSEEAGVAPGSDSGRFLTAGARRSFWVRTPAGRLAEAVPRLRRIIDGAENVIIESNSILQFFRPDLCAMVLDGAVADFKASSRRFLDRADVLVPTSSAHLVWPDVGMALLNARPQYPAPAPGYESELLNRAIRECSLKVCRETADIACE